MKLMDLGVETIDIVTDAGNEYECALDTGEARLGNGRGVSAFAYDADDLLEPGACKPALSQREYELVRMAFDQAKQDK